jgi:hypothetical protein
MKSIRHKSCECDKLWICTAFLYLWAMAFAVNASSLIGITANDLTLCEYNKDASKIVQVHADRMFVDYERLGFFRIGVLPKLVFENIQIEIQSGETLTNVLGDLQTWKTSTAISQRLELKNVEIKIIGETHPRLSAATAHTLKDNVLELVCVSLRYPDAQPIFIPKAILHLTGSSSGKLCWNSAGKPVEVFVFNSHSPKIP